MRITLLSAFLLLIHCLFAQSTLQEYTDIEQEEGKVNQGIKYQDKIIYVGSSFETSRIPTMICVDTSGTVVWNTAISDATNYTVSNTENQQFKLILGSDGFVYSTGMKNGAIECWKVNPATGSIIWKQVLSGMTYQADYIKDYNSTHFLLAYNTSYNGINYVKVISSINKSTGVITTSKTLGSYPWQKAKYCIEIDNSNNIYYSIQDSIIKLDANDWNNVLWQVKYISVTISTIPNLYYNINDGKIVAVAVKTSNLQNHILSIDGLTGTLLTTLPISLYEQDASQVTMRNNSLFISFQHIYVGGSTSFFTILKYDLMTYNLSWMVNNNFGISQQAIRSFDFDDNDNIFCTGYYESSNYGPGKWGILKLSPTGVTIYSKYIFRDSSNIASTDYSDGMISLVLNNKPCFVGILDGQYSSNLSNACFIRLNNITGIVEMKKFIGGHTLKFDSRCIDLISYQNNKKLALIKRGRIGQLICFDSLNNVEWITTLAYDSYDVIPCKLASTSDGNIWVSIRHYSFNYSAPYVSSVASEVLIYKISNTGAVLNTLYYNSNIVPLEFLVQNNEVYHLYMSSSTARIKKISTGGATESNLNFSVLNNPNNNFVSKASPALSFISGSGAGVQTIHQFSDAVGGIINSKSYTMSGITFSCSASLNSTNLLIGAKNSASKSMILCFNSTINDTLWSYIEPASISENQIKLIVPDNASSFYLLSNSSSDIIIRKINSSNGNLIWKSVYNGSLSNNDFGQDISFDSNRNQIIVSGYETYGNINNKVPLILKLDTLGVFIDTVKIMNSANYLNGRFNEVLSLSDGSVISGGSYNSPINGISAVINLISNPVVHVYQTINQCSAYMWPINGQTYTNSGTYYYSTLNNPDTIHHLYLSINSTSFIEIQSSCNTYTWPINGQTYTVSGQYADTIPNTLGCDSIITLDLTIHQPTTSVHVQTVCDSLTWIDGITYYSNNTSATHTITNTAGCDSIVTLNLTIIPAQPIILDNSFSLPSDANNCIGQVALTVSGNSDFEINIDNGVQLVNTTGYSLINSLCPGLHDAFITDNCGDTLHSLFVIPIDSNYVYNNPYLDSIAVDSLGVTLSNCTIYYNSIDTAYIDSVWAVGNVVNVVWNIIDSNGSNFDTTSYILSNGNGVYLLQLSVFCPTKSLGDYFTVTEAYYFEIESASIGTLFIDDFNNFNVFPNPTHSVVTLNFNENHGILTVTDSQGRLMSISEILNGDLFSMTQMQSGIYFFELNTPNGKTVKRIVKN